MSWKALVGLLLCLVVILATDERRLSAQETPGASVEADIPTAPVEFDGKVLLRVRGVSSLPAAERARLISERLTAVAADTNIPVDAFHAVESAGASRIV